MRKFTTHDFNDEGSLSPAGQMRREAMLCQLQGAMRRHHRRRRMQRGTLTALGLVLIAGIAGRLLYSPSSPQPQPVLSKPRPIMLVEFVRTQPDIVERYRAQPPPLIERIQNDASLVQALRDIGRPAGLIRIDGKLQLTGLTLDEPAPAAQPSNES